MRKKITEIKASAKKASTKKASATKTEIAAELEAAKKLIAQMQDPAQMQEKIDEAKKQAVIDYKKIEAKKIEDAKNASEKAGRRSIRLESFKNDKFAKYKNLSETYYNKFQKYKALAKTQGKLKKSSTRTGGSNATYDKLSDAIIKAYLETGDMPDSGNYNKRTLDNFKSKYKGILENPNKKYKKAGNETFIKRLCEMQMLEGNYTQYIL